MSREQQIAATIKSQISRNTFMCLGASNFTYNDSGDLTFRFRADRQRRYIRVHLNGMDLYDVEQIHVRGGKQTVRYRATNIYCDQLDDVVFSLGSKDVPESVVEGYGMEVA